ncbi:CDK2-associated and cullin domain-containing protein 1 isoform X3 [Lathamus discolor]|uniref:CDK2-associated and cullin domain-containing protein 1 isoform X3 n=1 Tax=Lathamus discolor TaxID=678569 RepID=UPI0032B78C9F
MEEESMEEEGGGGGEPMMDDQNHNNWGAGGYGRHLLGSAAGQVGDRFLREAAAGTAAGTELSEANGVLQGCDPGAASCKGGAGAIAAAININASTSKFLMNVITIEDYKSTYWPKLDSAIDQLLTQSPGDYIPISYEQIYSCVYKCVCQQHSEQMYSDLIKKITNHLERVSKELQNKFYIETKLNRDLKDDLIKLFTEHVAEKHIYNLMPLLLEAQSTPFQITPSTMANIVKGLYTLRPEWVQMAPALFSKFIPNILPPAVESELQEYAAQDQKLQRELMQNGFTRIGQLLGSISLVKDLNQGMHSRSVILRVSSGKNISYYWKKNNNFCQLPADKCDIITTVMKIY